MKPNYYRAAFCEDICQPFSKTDIEKISRRRELRGDAAMRVLMGGKYAPLLSSDEQSARWDKLKDKTEIINLILNYIDFLDGIDGYDVIELEKALLLDRIQQGYFGAYLKDFFSLDCEETDRVREIILLYYVQFMNAPDKQFFYEKTLRKIFGNQVTIYYDRVKKKVYVAFKFSEDEKFASVAEVCRILFADLFLDIELVWNCAPLIIDKTDYEICGYGEQTCSTII